MMKPLLDSASAKKVAPQDFMAVVPVGYGDHLYPFNEGPNVLSKALLPIANKPVISIVLEWIIDAGLTDILVIVPPSSYAAISNHLSEAFPSLPGLVLRQFSDGDKPDSSTLDHGRREGTARILKRFRSYIQRDFVVIPCDLIPPSYLRLSTLLDRHRSRASTALSVVFYEASEAVRDSEERILTAYDKQQLLLIENLDSLDEDFELRTTLLKSHPTLSLNTRLIDAHIYICRRGILDVIADQEARDLDSLKEQVIPWLVKCSWQNSLAKTAAASRYDIKPDPFAPAIARSTVHPQPAPSFDAATPASGDEPGIHSDPWDCQLIVTKPPPAPLPVKGRKIVYEPEYLVRANTLAGYWDINRRMMKTLPPRVNAFPAAQISTDSLIGEGTKVGERASLKKTIVGRHCVIGRGAKLSGCVIWDFCTVDENARLENVVLCNNVRVESGAQIKDCELGPGYEATQGAQLKGERLVAGQEV